NGRSPLSRRIRVELTRKEFLLLLVGGAAVAACGGSEEAAPPAVGVVGGNCAANGSAATIVANHGHVLAVSKADIAAGVEKTYDITGSANHAHQVTLTAADMAKLQANTSIGEVCTLDDGHTHRIVVVCT